MAKERIRQNEQLEHEPEDQGDEPMAEEGTRHGHSAEMATEKRRSHEDSDVTAEAEDEDETEEEGETEAKEHREADEAAHAAKHAGREVIEESGNLGDKMAKQGEQIAGRSAAWQTEQVQAATRAGGEAAKSAAEAASTGADAVVRSGIAFVTAMQEAGQCWVEFTQDSLQEATETASSIMQCKTVPDLIKLETQFIQSRLDAFARQGERLSEIWSHAVSDVGRTVSERASESGRQLAEGGRRAAGQVQHGIESSRRHQREQERELEPSGQGGGKEPGGR
jgi:hypothetical protein